MQGYIKGYVIRYYTNTFTEYENNETYILQLKETSDVKEQESGFFSIFSELEIETLDIQNLMSFCFEYMPSLIEILEPSELVISESNLNDFFTDLQAKLHHIDMVAKQAKSERDYFKHNMTSLLKNYLRILLTKKELTSLELNKLTGIDKDTLEDFLDSMIDQGEIDLKEDKYYLKENVKKD